MAIEKIDRKIILRLLKDGRASVRDISRYTGVSPQLVSYKIRSFISRGIIRSFSIWTSPNLYGYYYAFVAADNKVVDTIRISSWASCLERIEVVEIYSNTMEGLRRDIDHISSMSKEYYMFYIPPQRLYGRSPTVERFIRAIRSEPRSSFSRIAEIMLKPVPIIEELREKMVVEIISGPLKGFRGTIQSIDRTRMEVTVAIMESQYPMNITVPADFVRPLKQQ